MFQRNIGSTCGFGQEAKAQYVNFHVTGSFLNQNDKPKYFFFLCSNVRDRNIISLYSKCRELTDLMGDMVKLTKLSDTTVLHISTIGVAPFFVESIPELQLAALKLVTNVFR